MKYAKPQTNEWIRPVRTNYHMACCDCGLVHDIDFKVRFSRVHFRVRRNNELTAKLRRFRGYMSYDSQPKFEPIEGPLLTFASDNYYPLVLSAPEWSLHIQSKPKARIYRTGRIPTYQEIAGALQNINAPIWSIELFQVLIELAEVDE